MKDRQEIFQLTDFNIGEVSLVDHAANKRRFVIMKRTETVQEPQTDDELPPTEEKPHEPQEAQPSADNVEATPSAAANTLQEAVLMLREAVAALKTPATTAQQAPIAPAHDSGPTMADISKRLANIEKQFLMPNSVPVEGGRGTQGAHEWPFDLNARPSANRETP